jgi:abortive infection bacteriophage resistance protein
MDKPTVYDKPFKDYNELIEIMKQRHIEIDDNEFAIHALQNFSYYGIVNGYKNTFLQIPGTDNFIPGTQFTELYTLHLIDTSLNNVIFKYILYLEKALKSRLSYLVAQKYGVYTDQNDFSFSDPNDYLYARYYSNSTGKRINILKGLKEYISRSGYSPIMLHYINHKNHIPPWILTTNIPYGLTIEWFNILKSDDKKAICDSFISPGMCSDEKNKEFIRKSFEITKEYRNKIAHGNRTFSIDSLPQLPKEQLLTFTFNAVSESEYNNKLGQNDTMAVLLSLMVMLCDPYLITNFRSELSSILMPYHDVRFNKKTVFEVFGFPNDLFDRLENLAIRKFT